MTNGSPLGSTMSSASLWPPRLVSSLSAWNEHVPFAGWIIDAIRPEVFVELGTHAGVSYFAFCESVARLDVGTRCYAVDTWVGDEHAGEYGENIYADVNRLNSGYYEGFSSLLRTTFDDAAGEFADGSIDLLHIDGFHTYEAVKHDFETWLPKLSNRAVVLLHDTNERKADFGVFRFMRELAEQYPTFEFTHGHGLGIVCVGSEVPRSIEGLVGIDDPAEIVEIRQMYEALGRRLSTELEASTFKEERDETRSELKWTSNALDTTRNELADTRSEHGVTRSELKWTVGALEATRGELAETRGELAETRGELAETRGELAETRGELVEAVRESSVARIESAERAERLVDANRLHERDRSRIADQAEQLGRGTERERTLGRRIAERDQQIAARDAMYRELTNRKVVRVALRFANWTKPVFGMLRGSSSTTDMASAAPQTASGHEIRRQFEQFDEALDARTSDELQEHYRSNQFLAETLVSVVLPTFNRAEQIQSAIASVQAQTHVSWELLVVDDGSTDGSDAILQQLAKDPRIHPILLSRGGVSRARNAALDVATGDVIAFLDSDNEWYPEYLELMVAGLNQSGSDIAYSGMRLRSQGETAGYRGERFDYAECASSNYVDINVLCHRRSIADAGNRFDESLRRMNDWDYLLRIARDADVTFLPFVGADYKFEESDDQISVQEPVLYRKIIQRRHASSNDDRSQIVAREIFREVSLRVGIRIAAPRNNRNEWGDYHFALGVAQALERRGHRADVLFRGEDVPTDCDIVISLRGLVKHPPVPVGVNVLWSISHPDLLTIEEIDGFDLFMSASLTWPNALAWARERTSHTMLQASDRARFYPREPRPGVGDGDEVLFVGNSRGVDRWIVDSAAATDAALAVYGAGWEGRIPDASIRGTYLPNETLGQHYADATVVLNDHWESMRRFGYVSNRVFDVTASGGTLISDDLPSMNRVFGDAVTTVRTEDELVDAISENRHEERGSSSGVATWVVEHHSFDNRVDSLLRHVEDFLFSREPYDEPRLGRNRACSLCRTTSTGDTALQAGDGLSSDPGGAPIFIRGSVRRLTVGILPQATGNAFTSSTYIRLVQPLTTEIDGMAIDLIRIDADGDPASQIEGLDAVIVSRVAVEDEASAAALVDEAGELGIPLIVDVDDAFHMMEKSHPEFEKYAPKNAALSVLLNSAAEVWASTKPLADSLSRETNAAVVVVPNSLDQRLWKPYRAEDQESIARASGRLEILYAGTLTHGDDLTSILPALDELAGDVDFALTVIGVSPDLPDRPWLRSMSAGPNALYPRYARWLRGLRSGFDVGIAPLIDSQFNAFKSDIKIMEYLALGMIPIASDVGPYSSTDLLEDPMRIGDLDDWTSRLHRIVDDPTYRDRMHGAASKLTDLMWHERSAHLTGADLVSRIETLITD